MQVPRKKGAGLGEWCELCFREDVIKRLREDGYDDLANITSITPLPAPAEKKDFRVC